MAKEYKVRDLDTIEELETTVTTRTKGRIYYLPTLVAKRDKLTALIDKLTLLTEGSQSGNGKV